MKHSPTRTKEDAEIVEKQRKRAEALAVRDKEDLRVVMSTPQGRRFLWAVMAKCGILSTTAVESPHFTYFNEGRRSVGTDIFTRIHEVSPDAYIQMVRESQEDKNGQ